jgi:outer membrane receptor protein involved in Fe transport
MLSFKAKQLSSDRRSAVVARWRLLAMTLVAITVTLSPAYSQILYGTLTGSVTDQTGAVLPGARVQALNVATNVAMTATTNERGIYVFSNLLPGVYDVTIEAASFKTVMQKGVTISVNSVRRVNAQLEVTEISETIEVSASAVVLQTDRSDVQVTQTTRQINELPIAGSLGRNYQSLMQIVPGAVIQRTEEASGEANSTSGSPQRAISFSANGVSGMANQTRIDGSPVTHVYLSTNTAYVPSAEAIEEVSIVTNSYNANQGMAGGAAVNVVIKSGTNSLHGAAWAYETNSHFTARHAFQTTPQVPKNIVAQFGGNLGGPIVKDKLFFFGNVERTTQRVAPGSGNATIAPANLRPNSAGDVVFPTPAEDPTYGVIIYDPLSNPDPSLRTPFPNNTIPAGRIDQAAQWFLERMPLPQREGYQNNYTTTGAGKYNRTNMDFKVNYLASNKLSIFARYGNSPHNIIDEYALGEVGGPSVSGGQPGFSPGRTQVYGAGLTYLFSPTLMLDANVGHTRQKLGAEASDIEENIGSDPDKLGIPGTNGPDRMQGGIPGFNFTGWTNLGNNNTGNPYSFNDRLWTASASLQKIAGPHVFRLGAEYQVSRINHFQPQGGSFGCARGTFAFSGNVTSLQGGTAANQLNSWADFLLGLPSQAGKADQLYIPNSVGWNTYAAYIMDTWQVSKALTINLGLRWEYYGLPYRPEGKGVSRFDVDDGWVYLGGYGSTPRDTGAKGAGRFMPRVGLAYRLNEKTVLRAGYGRSQDNFGFQEYRNAWPTQSAWNLPAVQFNGADNAFLPVTTLRQGLQAPAAIDLSSGKLRLPENVGTTTYPKDSPRGAIDTWNVAVQRELTSWLTAQVAYVGTRVDGQMGFINVNAGPPGQGNAGRPLTQKGFVSNVNISSMQPYGETNYAGLQTELRVRSNSFQGGITYTYSKTTNYFDNTVGWATGAGGPWIQYMPEKELNKGRAGYDRTHVFNLYGVWDLPFGKGKQMAQSGIANALLGGWQINGMLAVYSGNPIMIIQGNAPNLQAAGSSQVPDQIAPITINKDFKYNVGGPPAGANVADYQYFSVSSFQAVDEARFGNRERNNFDGPGYYNLDLGIFRTIDLPGDVKLQLRAEALNALNHPNFRTPTNKVGGNDISNATQFGTIRGLAGVFSRNIRFAVRLSF